MSQQQNALIKRASLYPLSFDDTIAQNNPIHGSRDRTSRTLTTHSHSQDSLLGCRGQDSYEERIARLEKGMINIQDDYLNDSPDEIDDIGTDTEQDYFEDIIPICEKSFPEEE
ncbi:7628_t:CDS:2 [Funneliformis caledonium]|uniref:7628_t:CDS:1 n=1 Tax=Funneliformis caledonium TaxID=1117310 RepID=A0A9N9J529_9GLOM|nr:7628_t:CDS:2 [Funneliformis caledonium]